MVLAGRLIPTADQESAIRRMVDEPTHAALNASEMGAGKTLMSVEVAIRRGCQSILIIGPLGTITGWAGSFERQGSDLPFYWIGGKDAKTNLKLFQNSEKGIFFIGTELFSRWGSIKQVVCDKNGDAVLYRPVDRNKIPRKIPLRYDDKSPVLDIHGDPILVDDWRVKTKKVDISTWKKNTSDMVINDEAHRGQNRNGQVFRVLKHVKTGYKMSCSGTPYGNKFSGAWAVARWLWPSLTDSSYHRWVAIWCETEDDFFAGKKVTGEKVPGAFFNSLPCYVRIVPPREEPEYIERFVDLRPRQRAMYNKLERDLFVMVEGNPLVIEVPAVVRIRLREATLAEFSVTEDQEVYFKDDAVSAKLDDLSELFRQEAGNSMLILTHSAKYARILVPRIKAMGYPAAEWSGRVDLETREVIRRGFQDGRFPYLVATIPSIREGIDGLADNCGIVVNISHDDNGVWDRQALARIIGRYKGRVKWYDILARHTYDTGQVSELSRQALQANQSLREKKNK